MDWCSGASHPVRRLRVVALAALLTFACGNVFAQDYLAARSVTPIGPAAGGTYLGQGNFIANGQHIPAGYYKAPVTYNKATLGSLARGALRGAARFSPGLGTALTAVAVATWVYDVATGMVNRGDGIPQAPLNWGTTGYWCMAKNGWGGHSGYRCASTKQAAAYCPSPTGHACQGINQYGYMAYETGYMMGFTWTTTAPSGWTNGEPYTEPTPVSDAELGEEIGQMSPDAVAALLHDPYGNPHRVPELVAAEEDLADKLRQKYPDPTQTPVITPGTTLDPNDPNASPDPEQSTTPDELPAFCEWAGVVCKFIDWVKTPTDHQDVVLPEEELAISQVEWSSGLASSGTCPAPFPVDVELGGHVSTFEFSLQWLCDFAALLRAVVIAVALCVAGYIVAGLRGAK